MRHELLRLMVNFSLCYQIPGQLGVYIAPQLLSVNRAEYEWASDQNLVTRYSYVFMPKGIVTQFIVATHQYIVEQSWVWKAGVVIERGLARAEVIESYGRRELNFRVAGKEKKELMAIVTHEL